MATVSNVRITGDTSGLSSNIQSAARDVDRLNESLSQTSDLTNRMSDVNLNVNNGGIGNGGYSPDVTQALNTVSQSQQQVTQVIQNNAGNNNNGGMGNVIAQATSGGLNGSSIMSMLSKAGPVGMAVAAGIGTVLVGNKFVEQWEKDIPQLTGTYAGLTSGLGDFSAKENSHNIREMFDTVNSRRFFDQVKFKNDDYMKTMDQLSRYGYSDWDSALNDASNVLKFENAGMGSRSQLISMSGLAQRFGLENALNSAYAGLEKSGMQKGQFDEFLSSMEDILESGISKGFVRAAEDISTDMVLLEKLSGGSALWQGQYAAENLAQMNSALENATSLGSVNDVLLYQAMSGLNEDTKKKILNGGYDTNLGYINDMMILERGVNADNIGAIFDIVNSSGGTAADKIARYKNMFGLNYTKAKDVYEMSLRYNDVNAASIASEINSYQADVKNESYEQRLLSSYETMSAEVKKIGSDLLGAKSGVLRIVDILAGVENENINLLEGRTPFSSEDELLTFEEMLNNYEGKYTKSELNDMMNMFFNENSSTFADILNFQNNEDLKAAWEARHGTLFFDTMFNPDNEILNTPYGPMKLTDWQQLTATKGYNAKNNLGKNIEKMTKEDILDLEQQYKDVKGKEMGEGSVLDTLKEIVGLIQTGSIVLKTSGH